MIQEMVLIVSLALMSLVFIAFLYVFINSEERDDSYKHITASSYALRKKLFWILGIIGVFVALGTTRNLPYANTVAPVKEISIVGKQWYWELSESNAKVGEPLVFNVTSTDVNHGLGIYDENLRLLGQVQAMPNYTNRLPVTFKETGKYQLMCMEYCGLVHHAMIADFNVTN